MAKGDTATRINAQPSGLERASSTVVTPSQVLGGDRDMLAGWTITPVAITKSGVTLHSGGWLQAGSDGRSVRLDASHATHRLWAGHEDPALAPFSVDAGGVLRATGAIISGDITAETGHIGGWTIGSTALTGGGVTLDSTGAITLGSGATSVTLDATRPDYRLWAGAADPATAPFRITATGELVATGATISGTLQSPNFASGVTGWRLDAQGDAELNNVRVRGILESSVFRYDVLSAMAGSLVVTPTASTLAEPYTAGGTLVVEPIIPGAWVFAHGERVRIRAAQAYGELPSEVWVSVGRRAEVNHYWTSVEAGSASATWQAGTAVLGYGTGGGGSLYMTATGSEPFFSVRTHGWSPWTDQVERARLGDLSGIAGASGYGLWTNNGFFTGRVTATSGEIAGRMDISGAAGALAIGSPPPVNITTGTGLWLDRSGLRAVVAGVSRALINGSGVRIARDSDGLRFVANADIAIGDQNRDGRIFYASGDTGLRVYSPSGYLTLAAGGAKLGADATSQSFWKLHARNDYSDVVLAFGTTANNFAQLTQGLGLPSLRLQLGTGTSPAIATEFYASAHVPSGHVNRSIYVGHRFDGGPGAIAALAYRNCLSATVMITAVNVTNPSDTWHCFGSIGKPTSGTVSIGFTNTPGSASAANANHYVWLSYVGDLCIQNNTTGTTYQYSGLVITTRQE